MPKVKIPRKSTWIDMTAMCDVAFLLLTFFMLTSNFVKKEPVSVITPSSVSEVKIQETNILTILIDKDGKVFVGMDAQDDRRRLLEEIGKLSKITFTPEQIKTFTVMDVVGNPIEVMQKYLSLPNQDREKPENNKGIPVDSTDNQFKVWVQTAFKVNTDPTYKIAIKADGKTPYSVIKKVMSSLQDLDKDRYNLITTLEGPEKK